MSRNKWVIFDAMGVVYTVGDDTRELFIPFVRQRNPSLAIEQIYNAYLQASLGEISSYELWDKLGFGDNYSTIQKHYLDSCLKIDGQFIKTAQSLKVEYRLAMLSNDVGEWSAYLRQKFGLGSLFDEVIISSDVGYRKPSRKIYELMLNRIGARSCECVFIDDSIKNLEAALSLE